MKVALVIVLVCFVGLALGGTIPMARFDNFKMYKVSVENEEQLEEFKKMGNTLPVQYLTDIGGVDRAYDVVIDPAYQEEFEQLLKYYKFLFKLMTEDLQQILDERLPGILNPEMEWTAYHSLDDIYDWLDNLVLRNPLVVTPFVIGKSYEGRPIKGVRISRRPGNKAIFVESNIHAVEWISSAASTCLVNNLMTSEDEEVRRLTEEYDWIYIPVMNPDGLEYTHNVCPLWRKNRKPTGFSNSSGICYGTDMNRNFDYQWAVAGWNIDVPCDHWYAGSEANSEPEVQALQQFVSSFPEGYIRMYLAIHSYGNWVLLPYGHTTEVFPDNYDQMMSIAKGFADAALVKYGTNFTYGASGLLNYPVSGSSKDWAYGVQKIPFTATIELRDKGTYGFFLPASQIQEVCDEVTDGFVGMIRAAENENLFN